MGLLDFFKKKKPTVKTTPEEMPVEIEDDTAAVVEETPVGFGAHEPQCKCIHCHKEFSFDDFIGLCTSKECYNSNVFIQDIDMGLFNPDLGPRQILLRTSTRDRIPTINEEYPIDDITSSINPTCPVCSSRIFFYACPHCRHAMPKIGKEVFDNMIAPAGIGASGKSIYMTVLINQLMEAPILQHNIQVISSFTEIEDLRRYGEKYRSLFREKIKFSATQVMEMPTPYLLRTTTTENKRGLERHRNTYTLWYDFGGEHFEVSEAQHYALRYFAAVKGILLFVDPTNSPALVKKLELEDIDNASRADHFNDLNVITQVQGIMEKVRGQHAMKNNFIAVIVNKIDLFKGKDFPFFQANFSPVWEPSPHQKAGGFVLSDYKKVEEEVISYLKTYHSTLYGQLQNWSNQDKSNIGYFGVSALGNPLVEDEIFHDIHPIRVEDPFYWLLWKLGNLPLID